MTTARSLDQMVESHYGTCRHPTALIDKRVGGRETGRLLLSPPPMNAR
jgi:hypothetical protein